MYQVAFSEQSIGVFNQLRQEEQLVLIEGLGSIDPENVEVNGESFGKFTREGVVYYRLRVGDYRIYFELRAGGIIYCDYILNQHTFTDFLFRSKLPVSEKQLVEQNQSFWEYLESLTK